MNKGIATDRSGVVDGDTIQHHFRGRRTVTTNRIPTSNEDPLGDTHLVCVVARVAHTQWPLARVLVLHVARNSDVLRHVHPPAAATHCTLNIKCVR